jgi:WD40 repeat protein
MQGTTALVGTEGGDVRMYSLLDGSCELVMASANEPVTCIQVAWDVSAALSSPIAAVGHMTGGITVWDLMCEPEDPPMCQLKGHRAGVTGLAFRDRGEGLLSSSLDGAVIVWDVLSGTRVNTLLGHSAPVNGVLVCHSALASHAY